MKIIITGASGFIGRPIVAALAAAGHDLLLLSRIRRPDSASQKWIQGDLSDTSSLRGTLKKFRPEGLIHLAWEGLPDYSEEVCNKNKKISTQLFTLLADIGCSALVGVGSCWEYHNPVGSIKEEAPCEREGSFSGAKAAIREYGELLSRERDVAFRWVRPFFVYGPGQRNNSLLPSLMTSLERNEKPTLLDPAVTLDFIYVDDVANALAAIIETTTPGATLYNVGSGQPSIVRDIATLAAQEYGSSWRPELKNTETQSHTRFWADMEKMDREIGWSPAFTLQEGIRLTVADFKKKVMKDSKV